MAYFLLYPRRQAEYPLPGHYMAIRGMLMQRVATFVVALVAFFAAFAAFTVTSPVAQAANCEFTFGFATLHSLIPKVVGNCVTNVQYAANGDGLQQTSNGLLVWRKADNHTAFTNGSQTWVNGPFGLQTRPNNQRFLWEKTSARVNSTQVIDFVPPTTTSQTESGSCFVPSIASNRPDAFRCSAGNSILDPCFTVPGNSSAVVCTPNPTDPSTFVTLNLTQPLPPAQATPTTRHAWFLQLADETVCNFFTGATGAVNGERINYGCSDGWVVVGDPTTGTVWTVHEVLLPPMQLSPVEQSINIDVKAVWR